MDQSRPTLLFNSFTFLLLFLPIILVVWHLSTRSGKHWASAGVLTIGSIVFYSIWNAPLVFLLVGSIGANYSIGSGLRTRSRKKLLLLIGVFGNVVLLGIFKYAGFFTETVSGLSNVEWAVTGIALPLAISFFTFQQIAYLIDVYRGLVRGGPGNLHSGISGIAA